MHENVLRTILHLLHLNDYCIVCWDQGYCAPPTLPTPQLLLFSFACYISPHPLSDLHINLLNV